MSRRQREHDRRGVTPLALMALVLIVVLGGLAAVPARTWMTQQDQVERADRQLRQLRAEITDKERQLERLQTTSEIERRARQDFDLVYPGEESYRILPDGGQPVTGG